MARESRSRNKAMRTGRRKREKGEEDNMTVAIYALERERKS